MTTIALTFLLTIHHRNTTWMTKLLIRFHGLTLPEFMTKLLIRYRGLIPPEFMTKLLNLVLYLEHHFNFNTSH